MKQLLLVACAGGMLFFSCKQKERTAGPDDKEGTASRAKDSADIRITVTDFYTWYEKNYTKFNEYDLYSGIKKEDEPPYKINWGVVEKYQSFIRDSVHQLGEEFIRNQKNLFRKCDSAFKVDVNDEVPYYFDYDWYTNTQEDPGYLLEEMVRSKQWLISVSGDRATVDIKGFDENGTKPSATVVNLSMARENGKWKISRIGNDR